MSLSFTLSQLNHLIKQSISSDFPETCWLLAEINQISVNYSGHCYIEFIEKQPSTDKILAKNKATIWAKSYKQIKARFEEQTGETLKVGIKIMVSVTVEFHEIYGLSLNIQDIDPAYTIGDMEQRKQKIIHQLENEGIFELNKELYFPNIPKNIAIISSPTAAGYEDFVNQIQNNAYGFVFNLKLFAAIMQGNEAENSIIQAMEKIYSYDDLFDIVVIIRGGGSKSDLLYFDSYTLASNICQYPIPIVTGIGHERDTSIADMVANTSKKTPTAVAEFIIAKFIDIDNMLNELENRIINSAKTTLSKNNKKLEILTINLLNATQNFMTRRQTEMANLLTKTKTAVHNLTNNKKKNLTLLEYKIRSETEKYLIKQKNNIAMIEKFVEYNDHKNILKKGYSITRYKNIALKDAADLNTEAIIETELYKGKITSKIIKHELAFN